MSEPKESATVDAGGLSHAQRASAMFASLVVNQTQMAMMLLGRMPHPGTGQTTRDLEGARLFIDQLEMLEEKTRGNLDTHERKLLRDHLTALHMAFVEAAQEQVHVPETDSTGSTPDTAVAGAGAGESAGQATVAGESRKKFSKKY